jgi:sugar phosphate permease
LLRRSLRCSLRRIIVSPSNTKQLCLLYLISFLDRTNIGNAKIGGLETDLHITDGQYTAALSIFFISYSLFEPLTNILLKRLRPSIFLPAIMLLWGICMTTMGLTHNFSGLAAAVCSPSIQQ